MRLFTHINAATIDEAVDALRQYGKRASIIAGGTDLLGKMKDEILPTYPEALVNIKNIPGLDVIEHKGGCRHRGPARVSRISRPMTLPRRNTRTCRSSPQDSLDPSQGDGNYRR